MDKQAQVIEKVAADLLEKMGFTSVKISSKKDENEVILLQIDIPPEESGLLIGFHGETISALQLIIGQLVLKELGEWKQINLNILDYKQRREEALETMSLNATQKAVETEQSIALPYLNGSERRFIHLTLSENQDVETSSEGEGRQRRLIISPKKSPKKDE